jgi:sentrin-specific protease 1
VFRPRPPPLPALEKLRLQDLSLDAAIDERIRPKKRKVRPVAAKEDQSGRLIFPSQLPTALPSSADAAVTKMLHIRSGLVSTCGREQVQGEDIQRLRPAQWLNDEVINFYGAMITERAARWKNHDHSDATFGLYDGSSSSNRVDGLTIHVNGRKGKGREQGDPLDVHYFNTFFYEKLVNPGYEKARLNKWSKKVETALRSSNPFNSR